MIKEEENWSQGMDEMIARAKKEKPTGRCMNCGDYVYNYSWACCGFCERKLNETYENRKWPKRIWTEEALERKMDELKKGYGNKFVKHVADGYEFRIRPINELGRRTRIWLRLRGIRLFRGITLGNNVYVVDYDQMTDRQKCRFIMHELEHIRQGRACRGGWIGFYRNYIRSRPHRYNYEIRAYVRSMEMRQVFGESMAPKHYAGLLRSYGANQAWIDSATETLTDVADDLHLGRRANYSRGIWDSWKRTTSRRSTVIKD
jgi:hypothetical protein